MPQQPPRVFLRLGSHAEKEYFEKTLRFFDGLIVNANLVESTPGATASLLFRFGGQKVNLPYFLDPMTYAFGAYRDERGKLRHDLAWIKSIQKRDGKKVIDYKRSYSKLSEKLGGLFKEALSRDMALGPRDFEDGEKLDEACKAVLHYQVSRIAVEFQSDAELEIADRIPQPNIVFAPYFYMEPSRRDTWFDLALLLARKSVEQLIDCPVHTIVCADVSVLKDTDFLERIVEEVPATGVAGVWLWLSGFREDHASRNDLLAFRNLVERLSAKVDVYNRHGGFFSLALSRVGMSGVSHGVGYGEQKNVLPVVGQSTPTVRYYLPAARGRFGVPDIERCFDSLGIDDIDDFYTEVCDCVICKGIVSNSIHEFRAFGEMHRSHPAAQRLAQTPSAAKRCRFHFLLTRISERNDIASASLADLRALLKRAAENWGKQPTLASNLGYLADWEAALADSP